MKKCTKCGEQKPLSEFYQRTENNNKYMAFCKPCANIRTRKNYRTTKATKQGHAFQIFNKRKHVAKADNVPFDIDFDYMFSLPTDNCAILNTPLAWCELTKRPQANTPSIDKIIPEKGYVKGNVAWVSYRANTIKSNGNLDEHAAIVKYITSALNKNK